jgi:hypothetical protein
LSCGRKARGASAATTTPAVSIPADGRNTDSNFRGYLMRVIAKQKERSRRERAEQKRQKRQERRAARGKDGTEGKS